MTDIKQLSWFCPQPFINTLIKPPGSVPCCVMKQWNKYNNTNDLKEFQQEFLNGGGPLIDKHCLVCKEQEKHTKTQSHRLVYLDKFDEDLGEYREHRKILEKNVNTEVESQELLTLEYHAPNNFCNLKCNMCGPHDSSTYAKENRDIGIKNTPGIDQWLKGRVLRIEVHRIFKKHKGTKISRWRNSCHKTELRFNATCNRPRCCKKYKFENNNKCNTDSHVRRQ